MAFGFYTLGSDTAEKERMFSRGSFNYYNKNSFRSLKLCYRYDNIVFMNDLTIKKRFVFTCSAAVAAIMLRRVLNSLLIYIFAFFADGGAAGLLFTALSSIISHTAAICFLIRATDQNARDTLAFDRSYPSLAPLKICAVVLFVYGAGALSQYLLSLVGISPADGGAIRSDGSAAFMLLYFIVTVPLPAVAEELLFRGAVLCSLARFNVRFAIIAQAVMFALAHSDPRRFCYAFCGGLALGYYAAVTGSLRFPVIAHMANNALSFMFALNGDALLPISTVYVYVTVVAAVVICGIVGFIAHFRGKRDARLVRVGTLGFKAACVSFAASPIFLLWLAVTAAALLSPPDFFGG